MNTFLRLRKCESCRHLFTLLAKKIDYCLNLSKADENQWRCESCRTAQAQPRKHQEHPWRRGRFLKYPPRNG